MKKLLLATIFHKLLSYIYAQIWEENETWLTYGNIRIASYECEIRNLPVKKTSKSFKEYCSRALIFFCLSTCHGEMNIYNNCMQHKLTIKIANCMHKNRKMKEAPWKPSTTNPTAFLCGNSSNTWYIKEDEDVRWRQRLGRKEMRKRGCKKASIGDSLWRNTWIYNKSFKLYFGLLWLPITWSATCYYVCDLRN